MGNILHVLWFRCVIVPMSTSFSILKPHTCTPVVTVHVDMYRIVTLKYKRQIYVLATLHSLPSGYSCESQLWGASVPLL